MDKIKAIWFWSELAGLIILEYVAYFIYSDAAATITFGLLAMFVILGGHYWIIDRWKKLGVIPGGGN